MNRCICEGCKNDRLTRVAAKVAERQRQRAAKARQVAVDALCSQLGAQCLALFEKHKDAVWTCGDESTKRVAAMDVAHIHYAIAKGDRDGWSSKRTEPLRAEALRRILNTQGWTCMPWFGKGLDARLEGGR